MNIKTNKTWSFELNEDELKFLMQVTQNYIGEHESEKDRKMRITFFVNAAKALGYNVNNDGSMNRSTRNENIPIDIF